MRYTAPSIFARQNSALILLTLTFLIGVTASYQGPDSLREKLLSLVRTMPSLSTA